MSIGKRIKQLRRDHQLSQGELGAIAGVTDKAVSTWEMDLKVPRMGAIEKIAAYFGVTKSYIIDGLQNPDLIEAKPRRVGVKIPVLGTVAAGIPISAVEDILDYEEITPEMADTGEFFGLKLKGNSMKPRMENGDVVIIRQQPDVESGDVALVLIGEEEATVKKVLKRPDGIVLQPYNPDYEPMFFSPREIEELPVQVIGKVVELRGKL